MNELVLWFSVFAIWETKTLLLKLVGSMRLVQVFFLNRFLKVNIRIEMAICACLSLQTLNNYGNASVIFQHDSIYLCVFLPI